MQNTFAEYTARTAFERPLLSGVAYAERVLNSEREEFEREHGWTVKTIEREPSPIRDEYSPVIFSQETVSYIESLDMMSGEEDRENILRARASGKAVPTSPFRLLGSHHLGVDLTFPVYRSKLPPNPTEHERVEATAGVRSNEQLLIAYTKKSITSAGSLQIIPFEDQIISIVDAQQHISGQIFCIQTEFSLLDERQYFYILLICSDCKQMFTRLHSKRRFYCTTCRRSTNLIPRCQFEITVTDNSGSATALITVEPAETMLHLTSEEVYNIRCAKKQMLPLVNVTKQLTGKTFTIQMKKLLAKTLDGAPGKLIILSYAEKDNTIGAPSSPIPMDTTGSSKRKIEDPLSKKKLTKTPQAKQLLPITSMSQR